MNMAEIHSLIPIRGVLLEGPPQCLVGRGEGFNVSQYSQNTDKTAPNRTENVNDI